MQVPTVILLVHEFVGLAIDPVPLLHQRQAVGRAFVIAVFDLLDQRRHPHLEKFIQVARRNGKKLQPLQQWIVLVGGLLEHTPIKFQPGQFPVDEMRRTID